MVHDFERVRLFTMPLLDATALTGVQETLLMPLWARAVEAGRPDAILADQRAVEIVTEIAYDFDSFVRKGVDQTGYCLRAALIDRQVRAFLEQHPDAVVVEIGAGLDTRFERLDNGTVRWFDLDLPDCMALRRILFREQARRRFLNTSVLEPDWIKLVRELQGSAVLCVAEGVFYFFSESQLQELFARLASCLPGAKVVFDCQSPAYLRYCNWRHPLRNSRLQWAIGNLRRIESWDPRLSVEQWIGFGDRPDYDAFRSRLPRSLRLARWLCPCVRQFFRIVRVRCG